MKGLGGRGQGNTGLDDQDPSQWDDADLSHLVVPDADYPSDSEEDEGEEEEEEEEEEEPRKRSRR
jgi:hypothetical protein